MDNNNLDSPAVVVAASSSGTAAILVFAMMPLLVGGAADRFQLGDLESGLIATTYFSAYAIVALTSPIWIRRCSWRRMSLLGFTIMIASLGLGLASSSEFAVRTAVAASGLGAGILYPVSLTLVSDMRHKERVYGIKLAVEQLVPAGLLILLSLGFFISGGLQSTLAAILVVVFLCLVSSAAMPASGSSPKKRMDEGSAPMLPGVVSLTALAINFAGFAGIWVFMERIAAQRGFDSDFINIWLAVGLITSGLGPIFAALVSDRYGRLIPLGISTIAALASMSLLAGDVSEQSYALTLILLPLTYYFGISYIFSIIADADSNGRLAGLMSFALAIGSATGPLIFGAVRESQGPVLGIMASCMVLGAVIILAVGRKQVKGESVS